MIIKELLHLDTDLIDTAQQNWLENWNNCDVEKELEKHKRNNVKQSIAEHGAKKMTVTLLKEIDAYDEINEWFNQIKNRIE